MRFQLWGRVTVHTFQENSSFWDDCLVVEQVGLLGGERIGVPEIADSSEPSPLGAGSLELTLEALPTFRGESSWGETDPAIKLVVFWFGHPLSRLTSRRKCQILDLQSWRVK